MQNRNELALPELIAAPLLAICVCVFSLSYYAYFADPLYREEWEYVGGYTRIVIPDTFTYRSIIESSDPFLSLILSGVKNAILPSVIWYVADGDWIFVLVLNGVLLYLALLYIGRMARAMGIGQNGVVGLMALTALLPATTYHAVGALKEIPSMLFLTGFLYHYIKGDRARSFLFALFCVVVRYQLVFSLLLFLFADRFRRRALLYSFIVLIIVSGIYPLIGVEVFMPDETASFRFSYGAEESLGAIVESMRAEIPILSLFAVLVRIVQSIFEPFFLFARNLSFYEGNDISVLAVVYFISALPLLPYWFMFIKHVVSMLLDSMDIQRNAVRLYAFCLAVIYPTAGFSFVHHRYLYPMTALVLIAGAIRLRTGSVNLSSAIGGNSGYLAGPRLV